LDAGHIDDPPSAGFAERGFLAHDLVAVIPAEEKRVVGIIPRKLIMRSHGDVHPRTEFPLLDRRRVADELHELRRDAAIVGHGRALRCGSVTGNAPPLITARLQKRAQIVARAFHIRPQTVIALRRLESELRCATTYLIEPPWTCCGIASMISIPCIANRLRSELTEK